jgi:enamine deaminase RidA (YjgF/YER057c/UK114 family)
MQTKLFSWLGKEFVEVLGEARPGASAADQTEDLFRHIGHELQSHGLSLKNAVRSRLWGAALATGPAVPRDCEVDFSFVDGFAGDKYLIEIEATAVLTR